MRRWWQFANWPDDENPNAVEEWHWGTYPNLCTLWRVEWLNQFIAWKYYLQHAFEAGPSHVRTNGAPDETAYWLAAYEYTPITMRVTPGHYEDGKWVDPKYEKAPYDEPYGYSRTWGRSLQNASWWEWLGRLDCQYGLPPLSGGGYGFAPGAEFEARWKKRPGTSPEEFDSDMPKPPDPNPYYTLRAVPWEEDDLGHFKRDINGNKVHLIRNSDWFRLGDGTIWTDGYGNRLWKKGTEIQGNTANPTPLQVYLREVRERWESGGLAVGPGTEMWIGTKYGWWGGTWSAETGTSPEWKEDTDGGQLWGDGHPIPWHIHPGHYWERSTFPYYIDDEDGYRDYAIEGDGTIRAAVYGGGPSSATILAYTGLDVFRFTDTNYRYAVCSTSSGDIPSEIVRPSSAFPDPDSHGYCHAKFDLDASIMKPLEHSQIFQILGGGAKVGPGAELWNYSRDMRTYAYPYDVVPDAYKGPDWPRSGDSPFWAFDRSRGSRTATTFL